MIAGMRQMQGKPVKFSLTPCLTNLGSNAIRKWTTKGGKNPGQEMAFLSVEDNTGELDNVAIFSESWKEYKNIIKGFIKKIQYK